jgi:transposase-like protein
MKTKQFKNLATLKDYFTSETKCRKYLELARWGKSCVACPHCGSTGFYTLKDGKNYKCKDCAKRFNVLTKTVMENTKISLIIWFQAMYLMTSHKKGISSVQLGKDLGIAQKNAWYLAHRIRSLIGKPTPNDLTGTFEADESYFGGKYENMHANKKEKLRDSGLDNKVQVFGMVQRGGKLLTYVMKPDEGLKVVQDFILDNVNEKESILYTDGHYMYKPLEGKFKATANVNHGIDEYVVGEVHTNSIESFWSMLKRGIYGIYHSVSPKHLQGYCNEFSFRHNTKHLTEVQRFNRALKQIDGTKLGYIPLIKTQGSALRTVKPIPRVPYISIKEKRKQWERFNKAQQRKNPPNEDGGW